jgi:hypothetical protein
MTDPTTLKDLALANLTGWQARAAAAGTQAAAAQTALSTAVGDLAAATQALANAKADGERIRAALAAIPTSADAGPLLAQLDTATIAQRAAAAAILAAERALALARARLEGSTLAVRAAQSARVRAQAESNAADLASTQVAALVAALAQPPLKTLAADATDLLGALTTAAAQTAAEQDLPAALLTRARERATLARNRITGGVAARDAFAALIQAHVQAHGSTQERLVGPRAAYTAALATLQAFVVGAKQRLDRAQGVLTRLADPTQQSVLTAAQQARLNDADLSKARELAATHEQTLDATRWGREQAEQTRDLQQAKQAAGAANDLVAAQAALATAQGKETSAAAAYPPAERTLLAEWEAAAPDGVWADLADYDEAIAILKDLAATVPATLASALATAEGTLVKDLVALGKEQAARDLYLAELAARTVATDFDAGAADRIAFAALRGDA